MQSNPNPRAQSLKELVNRLSIVYRAMTICTDNLTLDQQSLPGRQQAIVFLLAKHRDGLYVKTLAAELGVTSSATTQLIDALVQKQLVQRSEDPANRRQQRIKLSEEAAAGFSKFHEEYLEQVAQVFDGLSNDELVQATALLTKVRISGKN